MKKLFAILMILCLGMFVIGCGPAADDTGNGGDDTVAPEDGGGDPAPEDPAPEDPAPEDPAPEDPAPLDPAPVDPAP